MATGKDKWSQAVAKLIQRTQDNRLKWRATSLRLEGSTARITAAFTAPHEDKGLRLYRIERADAGLFSVTIGVKNVTVVLEIIDATGKAVWTFPDSPANADLLSAVEYQVAGVDDFLEGLLRD